MSRPQYYPPPRIIPPHMDPVLAAEIRFKRKETEVKYICCFLLIILALVLFAVVLMVIFQHDSPGEQIDSHIGDGNSARIINISHAKYGGSRRVPFHVSTLHPLVSNEQSHELRIEPARLNDEGGNEVMSALSRPRSMGLRNQALLNIDSDDSGEGSSLEMAPFVVDTPSLAESTDSDAYGVESASPTSTTAGVELLTETVTYSIGSDEGVLENMPFMRRPSTTREYENDATQGGAFKLIPVTKLRGSCQAYKLAGYAISGVYQVQIDAPDGGNFYVLCLMEEDYGWMVLQRRTGPEPPDFWNASYAQYERGYGHPAGDHWLGLGKLHAFALHGDGDLKLRIILRGDFCHAKGKLCSSYGHGERADAGGYWWGDWDFRVAGADDHYRMERLVYLRGNLSDESAPETDIFSLASAGQQFTTVDRDNDGTNGHNGAIYRQKGGWWHRDYSLAALNGLYGSRSSRSEGASWFWQDRAGRAYNIKPRESLMLFRINE